MRCPECGVETAASSRACATCGAALAPSAADGPTPHRLAMGRAAARVSAVALGLTALLVLRIGIVAVADAWGELFGPIVVLFLGVLSGGAAALLLVLAVGNWRLQPWSGIVTLVLGSVALAIGLLALLTGDVAAGAPLTLAAAVITLPYAWAPTRRASRL